MFIGEQIIWKRIKSRDLIITYCYYCCQTILNDTIIQQIVLLRLHMVWWVVQYLEQIETRCVYFYFYKNDNYHIANIEKQQCILVIFQFMSEATNTLCIQGDSPSVILTCLLRNYTIQSIYLNSDITWNFQIIHNPHIFQ